MKNMKIRKVRKSTCWSKILKNRYNVNQIKNYTKVQVMSLIFYNYYQEGFKKI